MKFVKNYHDWLDESFIRIIKSEQGDQRPNPYEPNLEHKNSIYNLFLDKGYDFNKIKWTLYYQSHFSEKLSLPFDAGSNSEWWFCKLNPGDMFPMHQDLFKEGTPTIRRFWMACQNKQLGHIFSYGNQTLNDYRAGDLFEFENPKEWHAACNLGFETKISLQIVSYLDSIVF